VTGKMICLFSAIPIIVLPIDTGKVQPAAGL